MTVKKEYQVGDSTWIYGITRRNNVLTPGKVIHKFEIPGYLGLHYVVAIKTEIEDLLEIRTWENMSQDDQGPIGLFRDSKINFGPVTKYISKLGFTESEDLDDLDPTTEEINAALEKSIDSACHQPLILKENKPRPRKKYGRKRL